MVIWLLLCDPEGFLYSYVDSNMLLMLCCDVVLRLYFGCNILMA